MKRLDARKGLAVGASVATVALTAAAFWLSYEHLHDIAGANGLTGVRAWFWPSTVDLFIVAGELLILRASLAKRVDPWAIGLAAVGSVGSIALNVAGVGTEAGLLEYIVAAVPPVAALLAFGALMRQVHEHLAGHAEDTAPAPVPEPDTTVLPDPVADERALEPATEPAAEETPALPPASAQDDPRYAYEGRRLLSSAEVAEAVGVQPSTVRNWVAAGRLPVTLQDDRGRNWFDPDALPAPAKEGASK